MSKAKTEKPRKLTKDEQLAEAAELGLTSREIEKLEDAGLKTLGQLSDRQGEKGIWWLDGIAGLGEAFSGKVMDAWIDFWQRHPECQDGAGLKDEPKETAEAAD